MAHDHKARWGTTPSHNGARPQGTMVWRTGTHTYLRNEQETSSTTDGTTRKLKTDKTTNPRQASSIYATPPTTMLHLGRLHRTHKTR